MSLLMVGRITIRTNENNIDIERSGIISKFICGCFVDTFLLKLNCKFIKVVSAFRFETHKESIIYQIKYGA